MPRPELNRWRPRPEQLPDLFHPELRVGFGRPGQDQALAVPVDGERERMRSEKSSFFEFENLFKIFNKEQFTYGHFSTELFL